MTVDYNLPPDEHTTSRQTTTWDLRDAADRAEQHLDRADAKATHAFGAATFVAAGVFTVAHQPGTPPWAWVALSAGVGAPVAAALLCTVAAWLPRFDGSHGFAVYAGARAEDLPRLVAADQTNTAERLAWTARRVYRKYQLIRVAGLLTGFAVISAAVVGGVVLAVHLAG